MNIHENDQLVLRPSKRSTLGLLLGCSIFVGAGVWMATIGKPIGWIAVIFFGLGVVVALVQLIPNASYLVITQKGFEIGSLFRSHTYSWHEVTFFAVATTYYHGMVVFNFSASYEKAKVARNVAKAIAGYEGALPGTYGMKADQLADLLNEWKARFDLSWANGSSPFYSCPDEP
jgi:hypothetical protein